ncbi:hypothetical protein NDU88_001870 [Pleurodeles waltl]|uniref:RNase H type-1 domain-containing protein n=1 Tax=Pleurodeles waltl TaxID=8319 RepID=A0AAV7KU01_PLEWA|nr:hypothetical protein NDU88_001870 [Pleurodeles waltl]
MGIMDTPLDHMMKTFPSDKKRILKYCKQWHKGTEGHTQPWPKDGTFDHDIAEHTLTYIRSTYKKKKRQKREAILSLWRVFCHEKDRAKSTAPEEAVTPIQEVAQTQTESPGNSLGEPPPYGLYPSLPAAGYQDPVRVEPKEERLEAQGAEATPAPVPSAPRADPELGGRDRLWYGVTLNPATFFAHPVSEDEQVHDCATYTPEEESEVREDPIPGSMLLFVDGSSFIDQETGIRHTGAAVIRAEQQGSSDTLQIVSQIPLPSHFSAQAAELVAMIEALQHAEGLEVTIYSDSAYVTTTVHSSIRRWEKRGFLKSDGCPAMHKDLLGQLIKALTLPSKVAVIKCAAHTNQQDLASRGNALADWAAKEAAKASPNFSEQDEHTLGMMINRQSATELPPPYTETARLHLRELQEQALPHERELWEQRGCIQSPTDFIYRQEERVTYLR